MSLVVTYRLLTPLLLFGKAGKQKSAPASLLSTAVGVLPDANTSPALLGEQGLQFVFDSARA